MTTPLAIIAGAGPGVGAALARRFAAQGHGLALIARDADRLASLVAPVTARGGVAEGCAADLSHHAAVQAAVTPQYGGAVPVLTAVKSGLRGFVHASVPALAAPGLRLGTVTIAGQVAPGTAFDPDAIATAFWSMHDRAEPLVEHVFDGR